MTASVHTTATAEALNSKPITADYQPPISASSISTLMPKTVDYGHGHGMDNTQTLKLYFQNCANGVPQHSRAWSHC